MNSTPSGPAHGSQQAPEDSTSLAYKADASDPLSQKKLRAPFYQNHAVSIIARRAMMRLYEIIGMCLQSKLVLYTITSGYSSLGHEKKDDLMLLASSGHSSKNSAKEAHQSICVHKSRCSKAARIAALTVT